MCVMLHQPITAQPLGAGLKGNRKLKVEAEAVKSETKAHVVSSYSSVMLSVA